MNKRHFTAKEEKEAREWIAQFLAERRRERIIKTAIFLSYFIVFWCVPGWFGYFPPGVDQGWFGAFLYILLTHLAVFCGALFIALPAAFE